jgi:hypothetical protein
MSNSADSPPPLTGQDHRRVGPAMRHQQRESDPRTRMPTASRSPTHRPARPRSYSSNPRQAGGPALGRIGPPPAHQPSSSHEIPERHSGDISCAAMRDFPPAQRRMVLNCNPGRGLPASFPRASSLVQISTRAWLCVLRRFKAVQSGGRSLAGMAPVCLPCSRDRPCRPARPDSAHREKAGVDRVRDGRRC